MVSNKLSIHSYFHCRVCLKEAAEMKTPPREHVWLSIGATKEGMQVWCERHKCNVIHIDFEGAVHPANTKGIL